MSAPEPPEKDKTGARPIVATAPNRRGLWLLGAGLLLGGVLLFRGLESRRDALLAPSITAPADRSAGLIAAPPGLQIPPSYEADGSAFAPRGYSNTLQTAQPPGNPQAPFQRPAIMPPDRTSRPVADLPSFSSPALQDIAAGQPPPPSLSANPYVPEAVAADETTGSGSSEERVEAGRFLNPSTTVPKGTVIQAVLESALDSNRPGFARAIISRDVLGFDGTKILIPRGSRIIGEYKSDVALGQNRVLIQWQRLMRPDAIVINMDSPSADPLGRAGVAGKVDTHFFQRFAGAILQSALDIGVQLATREVSGNSVYVNVPGLGEAVAPMPDKIPPTVTIKQGKSVSVFVARDLDFTKVIQ